MKHFFSRLFPLIVIFYNLAACQDASQQKTVVTDTLSDGSPVNADTSLFYVNIRGDSISYLKWSPEDEMLGLGKREFGDLDSMIAREYIRVLVPYSKTYYYIEGMKTTGLAYDVLNLFDKELNKQLKFNPPKVRILFIPVDRSQVIPMLTEGYADIVAAGFTITAERKNLIDFSEPTVTGTKEIVVGGPSSPPIHSLTDLAGQQVYVRENTSYQASLQRLNDSFKQAGLKPIDIEFTDPYLEVEDILEMVNGGLIPFTITADDLGNLWQSVFKELKVYTKLAIDSNVAYGWGFRKNSPKLKATVDQFIKNNKQGTLTGNILLDKYLKNKGRLQNFNSSEALANLNRYKDLFKKYGKAYNLDWLLLAAQGYQESQLNHQTVSRAGAVGVMQVLPSTAAGPPIEIPDIRNDENNIHAGVKYMRFMVDHYFAGEQMDALNKHLFALAAYNCGPGMVSRLRRQAGEIGLNKNVWFNNVEKLAARHIGVETVSYVSNIYRYYRSFNALERYETKSGKKVM